MRKISMFVMLLAAGIGAAFAAELPRGGEIAGEGYDGWCSDPAHGVQVGVWALASAYAGSIQPTHRCTTVDDETVDCICCNAQTPPEEGCISGYIPDPNGCYCMVNNGAPRSGQGCTSRDISPRPKYPAYIATARWRDVDGDGVPECMVEECSSGREVINNDCYHVLNNWQYDCAGIFGSFASQGGIVEMSTGPHMCMDDNNEYVRCGCNDTACRPGYILKQNANYGGKMCVSKLGEPCAENEKPDGVAEGIYKERIYGEYQCGSKKCYCHATKCTDANITPTDEGKCIKSTPAQEVVITEGEGGNEVTQEPIEQEVVATQPVISISELAGRLAKVEGQFGLSKWRTADGEFNKARLASDLTAGVVLGTTGALVTASVVKKKQVKEGFEALECTVGGQHVGDYGDTFHISGK